MTVRLLVGNLDPRTSTQLLSRFFGSAGMAVSVEIEVDGDTGLSRGFGFVDLDTEEQAQRALIVFDGRKLGSRELRLERAFTGREERDRPRDRSERPEDDEGFYQDPAPLRREDHNAERRSRKRRHGKHGSDRIRGRGTKRFID